MYIVGRQKDVIIRGGNNMHAADVESVLYEHPAVQEVAVAGVPHAVLGEDVGAWVVLAPAADAAVEDELRAFCAERLSDYKVPRRVTFVDELPRNPTGKVVKRELPGAERRDRGRACHAGAGRARGPRRLGRRVLPARRPRRDAGLAPRPRPRPPLGQRDGPRDALRRHPRDQPPARAVHLSPGRARQRSLACGRAQRRRRVAPAPRPADARRLPQAPRTASSRRGRSPGWKVPSAPRSTSVFDALPDGEEVDFVQGVASPVPVAVIADLLGMTDQDPAVLRRWSDATIEVSDNPSEEVLASVTEFAVFLDAHVRQRFASPGDDLLSLLVDLRGRRRAAHARGRS